MDDTEGSAYTDRLMRRSGRRWKEVLDVQAPYRWNLKRQDLGVTLDVGCGIGRNLRNLPAGSVGVDHNPSSVAAARDAGLPALTTEQWQQSPPPHASFDSLLVAHVLEHMERAEARALLEYYLDWVRPGGRVFVICPQERGYRTDPTHVWFASGEDLVELLGELGLEPDPWRSFPFPRWAGTLFPYNEFTVVGHKAA